MLIRSPSASTIPDGAIARYVACLGVVLEIHKDSGLSWSSQTSREVKLRYLLNLLFDAIGDLTNRILKRCARPSRLDNHRFDGEVGIFFAA